MPQVVAVKLRGNVAALSIDRFWLQNTSQTCNVYSEHVDYLLLPVSNSLRCFLFAVSASEDGCTRRGWQFFLL